MTETELIDDRPRRRTGRVIFRRIGRLTGRRTERCLIGAIVAVSAVLNGWGIASMGWGNAYYSAAVRSMGSSWHSLFFAGFDSGGYVSVDKPPFALWVQVVSTKIFGYSRLAVLLPQVAAGAAAVWLLWWGLRRTWGSTAALIGAAALAVMPISVVVNHSNNTDSVLALLMIAAAVAVVEAVRSGRLRWLIAGCVFAGWAMTTKMLAAAPVMPGLIVAFVWCAPLRWRVRLRQAAIGVAVLAGVGLWWFVAVQATARDDRPYVGSTKTNSVFELAFERNGVNQVEGPSTGIGVSPPTQRGGTTPSPTKTEPPSPPTTAPPTTAPPTTAPPTTAPPTTAPPTTAASITTTPISIPQARPGGPSTGLASPTPLAPRRGRPVSGLGFTSGDPGIGRLLDPELGSQIGWLVPFALIGIVAALWSTRLRPSVRLGSLLVLGCWFGAGAIVFSFTKGVLHPYYMAGIAPPLAGLVGIGAATFRFDLLARRWRSLLGPVALAVTARNEWTIWRRFDWRRWFVVAAVVLVLVAAAAVVVALVLARLRRRQIGRRTSIGLAAMSAFAVLLAPAMWTQGSLQAGVSGAIPFAQPQASDVGIVTTNQISPNGGLQFPSISVPALVDYLRAHRGAAKWVVAVQSAAPAEEIIIPSGEPVMAVGGFIGTDPITTESQMRELVRTGTIRYFLLSAAGGGLIPGLLRRNDEITWVVKACPVVPVTEWGSTIGEDTARPGTPAFPGGPTASAFKLYDCRGHS